MQKPTHKPSNPSFSVGPCPKFPGWSLDLLKEAPLGRMHRSGPAMKRIQDICDLTKDLLEIPEDYLIAMVPGSATGAIEMAMWSFLGTRPADILAWDAFGERWQEDVRAQLKLENARMISAETYGALPDLSLVNFDHDVVFNWNGSSSGVCVPDGNWIPKDRKGLVICDATSSAFAMEKPWEKLDVTVFSWQKALGSEAAHGMIVLNSRAVAHLKNHLPRWPVPWIYGLHRNGEFHEGLFRGLTNNTPSLLCIEDYYQALCWAKRIGGLPALLARTQENFQILSEWVERTPWIDFAVQDKRVRSCTTVTLKIVDKAFLALCEKDQWTWLDHFCQSLENAQAVYDIQNHSFAPPTLRIWAGPTIQAEDMKALLPWLEWSFQLNHLHLDEFSETG